MKISLVIPTYGRVSSLSECLSSLESCKSRPDEVLILDQNDNENFKLNGKRISAAQKAMPETSFRQIHLEVKSSVRARNIGIQKSTGDIIVFSDDDIEYSEDNFSYLREAFSDNENALIGAEDLLFGKGKFSLFSYLFDLKKINPRSRGYYTRSMIGRLPQKIKEKTLTNWAMGYCFAVRKADILESGIFFDERMKRYSYAEDLDFTLRICRYIKAHGKASFYSNRFSVKHHCSKEYRIPSLEHLLSFFGNRYYLIKKNGSWIDLLFFYLSNVGYALIFRLTKSQEEYKTLKKSYHLFLANKHLIKKGTLDYVGFIESK